MVAKYAGNSQNNMQIHMGELADGAWRARRTQEELLRRGSYSADDAKRKECHSVRDAGMSRHRYKRSILITPDSF